MTAEFVNKALSEIKEKGAEEVKKETLKLLLEHPDPSKKALAILLNSGFDELLAKARKTCHEHGVHQGMMLAALVEITAMEIMNSAKSVEGILPLTNAMLDLFVKSLMEGAEVRFAMEEEKEAIKEASEAQKH